MHTLLNSNRIAVSKTPFFTASLICISLIIILGTFKANALTEGNYTYTVSGGQATITDFNSACSGILSITNTLGGYPVTIIGDNSFLSCSRLTSVTIPSGVTSIGDVAFQGCTSLTDVMIPDSVTNIGGLAFWNCDNLTSVIIPNSVTRIGCQAFYHCDGLTAITVDSLNPAYSSFDGILFDKALTRLVQCPNGKVGNVTIPDSVTAIGDIDSGIRTPVAADCPFAECSGLTAITVDVHNATYSSEDGVLLNKSKSTLIRCPKGRIGNYNIPNSVSNIAAGAFYGCTLLTSVTIPDNVTSIGSSAFLGCTGLSSITIPDSVTHIGNAFMYCTNMMIISVGALNPAYSSEDGVLLNKSKTTLIQCPNGRIGSYAIPSSVTSIGGSAFAGCTRLSNITIPSSITSIGEAAFYLCRGLTSVTLPDKVKRVEGFVFSQCTSLTNVIIGNSVTSIGEFAFQSCTSLASVKIPNSVTSIGGCAFSECTSLTSITIPSSVTSIGDWAFWICYRLFNVYFMGKAPSLGENVFTYDDNATVYYLPGTTGWGSTFGGRPTALWTADLTVTPRTTTSYGSLLVGTTRDLAFTVSNSGVSILSGSASVGAPFGVVSGGSYSLSHGQSITTTIRYAPVAAGTNTATLTFTGNGGKSLALTGSAYADPTPTSGWITGCVTRADTHEPLNNVRVRVILSSQPPANGTSLSAMAAVFSGISSGDGVDTLTKSGDFSTPLLAPNACYDLLVASDDHAFVPQRLSGIALVPGQATSANIELPFACLAPPVSALDTPVLLVRGMTLSDAPEWPDDTWYDMKLSMLAEGFSNIWDCNADGVVIDGTQGITANAVRLKAYIQTQSRMYAHEHDGQYPAAINIVAHSMGGLILRDALGNNNHFEGLTKSDGKQPLMINIGKVVMLGTPNAGTLLANEGTNFFPVLNQSIVDLTTGNIRGNFNTNHKWPDAVKLYLYAASGGLISSDTKLRFGANLLLMLTRSESCMFIGDNSDGMSDGAVPVPSVSGAYYDLRKHGSGVTICRAGVRHETLEGDNIISYNDYGMFEHRLDHYSMLKDPKTIDWVIATLKGTVTAVSAQYSNVQAAAPLSAMRDTSAAYTSTNLISMQTIEQISGTLISGVVTNASVISDAATTLSFQMLAHATGVVFRVLDPSGTVIDAATPAANTAVQYSVMNGGSNLVLITCTVSNPATGTWHAVLDGSSMRETQAGYLLRVFGDSAVALLPMTINPCSQGQNETVSCALGDFGTDSALPLMNASITAAVKLPDGTTTNLSLSDDGWHNDGAPFDGVYAAELANVRQPGTYSVVYRAVGTNTQGQASQRVATGGFNVSSGHGSIWGDPVYERLDTDGDGIADFLEVKCWVNPTVAGSYILAGDLVDDSETRRFSQSTAFAADGNGATMATLIFNLAEIQAAGGHGTFHIEDLQLFEATGTGTAWLDAYQGTSDVDIQAGKAVNVSPSNLGTEVSRTATLQWADGGGAYSYDVYFGTNAASPLFMTNQTCTTYDPGSLAYHTTYYWRIDARNRSGVTAGDAWSFTTVLPFTYMTNNGSITITGYSGDGGAVGIPSAINGLPVTCIGDWAFASCTGLTSVTIPDCVTNIGDFAFCYCTALTGVDIPRSVSSIGDSAFYYCTGLTSMRIPGSVTSIGDWAFCGCTGLTSVTIPDGVTSIGDWAFDGCTGLTSITIPGSVASIGDWAFGGCTGLASVTIPDGVTNIGDYAFCDCTGLTSITIPGSVTSIGDWAFGGCTGLTSITMPDGVTRIGNCAFYGCYGLTSITIPGSVTSIGDRAFGGCTGLTSVTIPDGVTSIGGYAFCDCTGLTSITIPCSVSNIGDYAFCNCASLTSITIPGSVTSIGDWAFGGCTGLTSITMPDGVTRIGNCAFYGCYGLTSITIPGSVTSIGDWAFGGCTGLTSVTIIPDGVTSIGSYAFCDCTGLTSITIPCSVTNIGDYAFCDCTGLTSITIPGSVTRIGDWAFGGCIGMTNVTISDGVKSIGGYAFCDCTGLTSITIPGSVTSIGDWAFGGCTGMEGAYFKGDVPSSSGWDLFPDNVTVYYLYGASGWGTTFGGRPTAFWQVFTYTRVDDKITITGYSGPGGSVFIPPTIEGKTVVGIGDLAFYKCNNLTRVNIPDSVTSIGDLAFYKCGNLASVTIGSGVIVIGDYTFVFCAKLTRVYFEGNAPAIIGWNVFEGAPLVTVYCLSDKSDWASAFPDRQTLCWNPQVQHDADFGFAANRFGFNIAGTTNISVVVEATTNLAAGIWTPLLTNTSAFPARSISPTRPPPTISPASTALSGRSSHALTPLRKAEAV